LGLFFGAWFSKKLWTVTSSLTMVRFLAGKKVMKSPSPLRIIFFGSGNFAIPALEALFESQDKVVLVVTTPPAKSGRGQTLRITPVANLAAAKGIPICETTSVNSPETIEMIERAQPELLVVVAFRGFLGQKLLSLGYTPPINIHPSLLPLHRGPAPVNWTLINGDQLCGVSITFVDIKVDAGPVLAQKSLPVPEGVGSGELEKKLSKVGAELLLTVIQQIKEDNLLVVDQDESISSLNRLLKKTDGYINFNQPSKVLASLINGVDPWPGAQASYNGKIIKLFKAASGPGQGEPGQVLGLDDQGRLKIGTGNGLLFISDLQLEGKTRLSASDFIKGNNLESLKTIVQVP
jgi:methionyl-tRNA formyltransferase